MPPRRAAAPTEAELEILQVLWELGPSSVREVQEVLNAKRPTGYTTVLKFLQIMYDKGYVRRDESERSHRYESAKPREQMQKELVNNFMDRVFGGSARDLVMSALGSSKTKSEDLDQIRAMLKERQAQRAKKADE